MAISLSYITLLSTCTHASFGSWVAADGASVSCWVQGRQPEEREERERRDIGVGSSGLGTPDTLLDARADSLSNSLSGSGSPGSKVALALADGGSLAGIDLQSAPPSGTLASSDVWLLGFGYTCVSSVG